MDNKEQTLKFSEQAIERVEGYFKNYDTEEVAEILADILHYVNAKGIDLHSQLALANQYVEEELSFDEEMQDA